MGCQKLTYSNYFTPKLTVLNGGASKPKIKPTWHYQWDLIHDPEKIVFGFMQEEGEGAAILPDAETISLLKQRLYDKVFKEKYSIKDFWTEEEKLKIITDINSQIFKLFYIKNESGVFKWDFPRFYSDKGIDQNNFDPKTTSEELRKEHEREYSLANYIIKNYTDLLLKPINIYPTSFNMIGRYFYDTKKSELWANNFKYPWIDGRTCEIIDPRNYYKNAVYDFSKLENDVKEFVLLKEEKYVNPVSKEIDAAKTMRFNGILSMYGEYMYYLGVNEIPNISTSAIGDLKPKFFRYWENTQTEQWGFYWTWNTLKRERTATEKARMIAQMQFEQELANYLQAMQDGKAQAWLEIGFGSATMAGSVLAIVFTEGGASTLTYLSMGFAAEQIAGGINMLDAIKNGFFDETKEYKIIKGLLINKIDDPNLKLGISVIYDLSSIILGVKAGGKTIESFRLSGSGMKKVIEGYSAGSEYVNVTYGGVNLTIQLTNKLKKK